MTTKSDPGGAPRIAASGDDVTEVPQEWRTFPAADDDVLPWLRRLARLFYEGCDDTRRHMQLVVIRAAEEIERLRALGARDAPVPSKTPETKDDQTRVDKGIGGRPTGSTALTD